MTSTELAGVDLSRSSMDQEDTNRIAAVLFLPSSSISRCSLLLYCLVSLLLKRDADDRSDATPAHIQYPVAASTIQQQIRPPFALAAPKHAHQRLNKKNTYIVHRIPTSYL